METKILEIKNLSHQYTVQWAIKNINIEIDKPGVYGLVGSNGAGKSTIMAITCGIFKPTKGNVNLIGIDSIKNPILAKQNIGYLPQIPPLHYDLTVEEYLSLCAGLKNIPRKQTKKAIEVVLKSCKIEHFKNRLIKNLSGGYQQRVGIAQAIIHNPKLVILDEPTNGLDPNQIIEIRNLIKNIAKNRTVILSTHILSEVKAVCDKIFMIESGQMVFSGTIEEFNNYIPFKSLMVSFNKHVSLSELENLKGIKKAENCKNKIRIFFSDHQEAVESLLQHNINFQLKLQEIYLEKHSFNDVFKAIINDKT